MQLVNAPNRSVSVFLAGSIEMGTAELWQDRVINALKDSNITVYNPRRPDWNSSWEQTPENTNFSKQVNWELEHLLSVDTVLFYFDPKSKSPITLLELGLTLASKCNIIVVCPDGFWRKGNVQITCKHYGVQVYNNLNTAINKLKRL